MVDVKEMAALSGAETTTVGAARATVRMTGAGAVVECGERRIAVKLVVVLMGVAVAAGPFKW